MKKSLSIVVVALFALSFVSACSNGGGDAATLKGSTTIDRFESMVTQMADVLESANGDASKAASGMEAYYTKNASAIQKLQKDIEAFQKDPAKGMTMFKNKKLMGNLMKLSKLMGKMMQDPSFVKAMTKFKMNMFGK